MKIGVIGIGNVGGALARAWGRKGHQIVLGVRNVQDSAAQSLATETGARLCTPQEAASESEVVVLALPWTAAESAAKSLGDLSGKIVVDCMNPLVMAGGVLGLDRGFTTSGGEALAGWLPRARVVKTLNQVGADVMADNTRMAHRPVMFMAGNDAYAKSIVADLLIDLGFDPHDAGDLTKARLLEPFGMVWINQALMRGKGRSWAFAAVPND